MPTLDLGRSRAGIVAALSTHRILSMCFGKEGGAERFFVNLARAFSEHGIEQRFVVRPGTSWSRDVSAIGPSIENRYRRVSLSALWLTWRVHSLVKDWQPDVIMAWTPRAARL